MLGVLREFRPTKAKARPDDYCFTGPQGGAVYTRDWAEDYGFFDVLTRLKVRQRNFYGHSTRVHLVVVDRWSEPFRGSRTLWDQRADDPGTLRQMDP